MACPLPTMTHGLAVVPFASSVSAPVSVRSPVSGYVSPAAMVMDAARAVPLTRIVAQAQSAMHFMDADLRRPNVARCSRADKRQLSERHGLCGALSGEGAGASVLGKAVNTGTS